MLYELRTYNAAPGKIDALNARFRDHTCSLFARHGIGVAGFWINHLFTVPVVGSDNQRAILFKYSVHNFAYTYVNRFNCLDSGGKGACMSDHIAVSIVEYDQIILTGTDPA